MVTISVLISSYVRSTLVTYAMKRNGPSGLRWRIEAYRRSSSLYDIESNTFHSLSRSLMLTLGGYRVDQENIPFRSLPTVFDLVLADSHPHYYSREHRAPEVSGISEIRIHGQGEISKRTKNIILTFKTFRGRSNVVGSVSGKSSKATPGSSD